MRRKTIVLFLFPIVLAGQNNVLFMGREMRLSGAPLDQSSYARTVARICVEAPPVEQCYVAPDGYSAAPAVEIVKLETSVSAILFSASTVGVSGWSTHFALLRPGDSGLKLQNQFFTEVSISNQGEHEFWREPAVSPSPVFVTADYELGPDESHYSPHRYVITAYVRLAADSFMEPLYYVDDRYLTTRKYDKDQEQVLKAERQEIVKRLRRVKAERERTKGAFGKTSR